MPQQHTVALTLICHHSNTGVVTTCPVNGNVTFLQCSTVQYTYRSTILPQACAIVSSQLQGKQVDRQNARCSANHLVLISRYAAVHADI